MSDPHRFSDLIEVSCHIQNVPVGLTGEDLMLFIIDVFDIQHHKIGHFQKFSDLLKTLTLSGKRVAAGIQCGVDALGFGFPEKFCQKIDLQHRFAAGDGDSAFFSPVSFVADCFFQQFICGVRRSNFHIPGIRVMAKLAAHRTSGHKDHISYSRSVYGTETFQ